MRVNFSEFNGFVLSVVSDVIDDSKAPVTTYRGRVCMCCECLCCTV